MKFKIVVRLWVLVIIGFALYAILPPQQHESSQTMTLGGASQSWTPPRVQTYMKWETS